MNQHTHINGDGASERRVEGKTRMDFVQRLDELCGRYIQSAEAMKQSWTLSRAHRKAKGLLGEAGRQIEMLAMQASSVLDQSEHELFLAALRQKVSNLMVARRINLQRTQRRQMLKEAVGRAVDTTVDASIFAYDCLIRFLLGILESTGRQGIGFVRRAMKAIFHSRPEEEQPALGTT